jgi:integrase
MSAYQDPRDGRWRYRARVTLPAGGKVRVTGTPAISTQKAAEHAERLHIIRVTSPGALAPREPAKPKEEKSKLLPTVKEFSRRFLDEYAATHKPSERRSKERSLAILFPSFGALRLDEVEQGHVQRFIAAERRRVSAKTVNNRLAVLSSLLKYAAECRLIPKPTLRFESGDEVRGQRIHALSTADVERLVAACTDDRYRAAILLGAEAGLRAGEIRGLQWNDIREGVITVRRSLDNETDDVVLPKHNKLRTVPLSPRLASALAALAKRGLWVVSRLDGDCLGYAGLHEAIVGVYSSAGVTRPPRPIHVLRHTFGTVAARRGVPLATLQDLMGHESIETTRQYVTVTEDDKRDAVARAFGDAGQQVGNEPARNERPTKSSSEK